MEKEYLDYDYKREFNLKVNWKNEVEKRKRKAKIGELEREIENLKKQNEELKFYLQEVL